MNPTVEYVLEMSKGSRPRKVNREKFNGEHTRIFKKRGKRDFARVPTAKTINRPSLHQGDASPKT